MMASSMKNSLSLNVAEWALRLSLATAFLAEVADRFGLCGPVVPDGNVAWGAWQPFVDYTGVLLFYLPKSLVSASAIFATAAEVILGVWLLTGWKTKLAAYASAALLVSFALSMWLALGWKAPFNYSVYTAAAAALALGAINGIREK